MNFKNRAEAGRMLTERLKDLEGSNSVILAIPRGGVEVAYEVAVRLHLPLDVVITRKLGAPMNPELAIGAVTDDGGVYINDRIAAMSGADLSYIKREIREKLEEAAERKRVYRGGRPSIDIKGKKVVIIDDGIATGATLLASINALKSRDPESIIVAVPVAPPDSVRKIEEAADKVICIHATPYFQAVGQFYGDFGQTSSEKVVELLKKADDLLKVLH